MITGDLLIPTPPVLTSSGGHRIGWYASYWNATFTQYASFCQGCEHTIIKNGKKNQYIWLGPNSDAVDHWNLTPLLYPHPTPTLIFQLSVSDCTSGESCTSDFACIPKSSICDGKPNCFMAEDEHCKGKATEGCVRLSNKAYNKFHTLWNILKQFCESSAQMFLRFDINDTCRMVAIVVCANRTICQF